MATKKSGAARGERTAPGNAKASRPNVTASEGSKKGGASQPSISGYGVDSNQIPSPAPEAEIKAAAREVLAAAGSAWPVDVFGEIQARHYELASTRLAKADGGFVLRPHPKPDPKKENEAGIALLNDGDPEPARRWTAAKLLYLILALPPQGDTVTIDGLFVADRLNADIFAAELLMPEAEVKQIWAEEKRVGSVDSYAVKVIANVFNVPLEMAGVRIVGLGLTTKRKAKVRRTAAKRKAKPKKQ